MGSNLISVQYWFILWHNAHLYRYIVDEIKGNIREGLKYQKLQEKSKPHFTESFFKHLCIPSSALTGAYLYLLDTQQQCQKIYRMSVTKEQSLLRHIHITFQGRRNRQAHQVLGLGLVFRSWEIISHFQTCKLKFCRSNSWKGTVDYLFFLTEVASSDASKGSDWGS